jgi:hypothetical protein
MQSGTFIGIKQGLFLSKFQELFSPSDDLTLMS